MAKKSAVSKGYRRQTAKKPYLSKKEIIALCVLAALVAVGAWLLFSYDDGALKVKDGKVVTDGDNWLIVDGSKVRGRARYYKLGEVGDIEGYTRENGTSTADENIPLYTFKPAEDGDITEITATTTHSTADTMAKYASTAIGGTEGCEVGGIIDTDLGGRPCTYFIYTSAYYEAEEGEDADASAGEGAEDAAGDLPEDAVDAHEDEAETHEPNRFTKSACVYFNAVHDSSVVIHVNSDAASADAYIDDDALLAAAGQAVAAITLEEGK